ncbi:MAG: PHB depolymerase family esterase [Tahibacter sp.]
MRRRLKTAAKVITAILAVLAALAFIAVHQTLPFEPPLPGTIEHGVMEHDGRTRSWIAYIPAAPLHHPAIAMVLHGSMGTAAQARQVFGYDVDRLAEVNGFIAVYPQGYQGHWNDLRVQGPFAAKRENVDDVGFLHTLVERLVKDHDSDPTHVYVTGVSNGGQMTLRLALQTPAFARAYAVVVASLPAAGNMAITPKGVPVSMLLMNGSADPFNPWEGGDVALYGVWGNRGPVLSASASIDYFLALDALNGPPSVTHYPDADPSDGSTADQQRWMAPGHRSVALIRIQGGGHGVPHPATYGPRLLGNSNRDLHAANVIWDFFQASP